MLITNFASGELSKTLFGRTDLRQYYCGAARMENFDVIPTGGIKRRPGMERLPVTLGGEGRIIPFIVNRDLSLLLYLAEGAIQVFRVTEDGIAEEGIVMGDGLRLYETIDEIRDVQYAQNYDTMILCHEHYPPLEAKLENNQLCISKLRLSFEKAVVRGNGVTERDTFPQEKYDETYTGKGRLTAENNYPAAVSFFNGRLVFAGTGNDRQRVFFSAVKEAGEPYNFATNKIFLTEKKEYVTVFAKAVNERTIQIAAAEMAIKFVRPLNEYYVDSVNYFPKGTRIWGIDGDKIELAENNLIEMELSDRMIGKYFDESRIATELIAIKDAYDAADNKTDNGFKGDSYEHRIRLGRVSWQRYSPGNASVSISILKHDFEHEYWIYYGVNAIQFVEWNRGRLAYSSNMLNGEDWGAWSNKINRTIIIGDGEIAQKGPDYIKDEIRRVLAEGENELRKLYDGFNGHILNQDVPGEKPNYVSRISKSYEFSDAQREEIVTAMFNAITETMRYRLHTEDESFERWYYGNPYDYSAEIMPYLRATQNIYVSFYTREIISDPLPTPDCGFTFEVASDMNDAIKWLAVNKGLIIGTESAEWIVPPEAHATSHYAIGNSRYGSDGIQGTAIGDATVFFQAGKKALVEYYIPQQDNNFRANNMALLSPQMLDESPAREFDFVSAPHIKLLVTREDGAMAARTGRNSPTGRILNWEGANMSDITEKKESGAKTVSLKSMIVGAVWIGVLSMAKALWCIFTDKAFGLTMSEILLSGLVMAAIFTPVYLGIILDKVKDIKIG